MRFRSRLKIPIPAELILVIVATAVSHYGRLQAGSALPLVGSIALGLPAPRVPPMPRPTHYVVDGLLVGVVAFAVHVTMARLMADRNASVYTGSK